MSLRDRLEILVCRWVIRYLKAGYGDVPCETKDTDDFPCNDLQHARCPNCHAWETIDFLEDHINLIRQ